MATLAPSLRNLFNEIDAVWPNRDRRTDGWIGDAAHQKRQSDHNPDSRGIVHAIDIDKDGITPLYVVEQCISESRPTEYVIWDRQIWSRSRDFRPRKYTGSNPHTSHIHVSIRYGTHWESANWGWGIASAIPGIGQGALLGATDDMSEYGGAFDDATNVFTYTGNSFINTSEVFDWIMR